MKAQLSTADFADALRQFVRLVTTDDPPTLPHLARALDELAMLVHHTPAGKVSDEATDQPRRDYDDYKSLYDKLGPRFPELGHYSAADPVSDEPSETILGDPIDDLADIIGDLSNAIWRYENVGHDEAIWYFQFDFQVHWGRHLRDLSLYLHALMAANGSWDSGYEDGTEAE